jgi:hypothetical protein
MTTLSEAPTRSSLDEDALFREAKRRERRRRSAVLVAVLFAAGGVTGGLVASGTNPPTSHTSSAPSRPVTVPSASSSTKVLSNSTGPYFMPGYFGRLSGHELWAASGLHFYLSRDGSTFTLATIPGLSADLATSLLAVAPAGPGAYAIAMMTGRGFGTCGHPLPPDQTTSEYLTSAAVAVTTDDGKSWTTGRLPKCGIVTSLSLVNASDGFALSEPGGRPQQPTLLDATTNGGRSWRIVGPAWVRCRRERCPWSEDRADDRWRTHLGERRVAGTSRIPRR